jgi:mannose-6-phosphate isomerase
MSAPPKGAAPVPLRPSFREKIWGSTRLEPWYPASDVPIGEIWFESEQELPILVKLLFTSDRLSVQVHPDDAYAGPNEGCRGKTEMWHILRADPGAQIAIGLREPITPARLREAAITGEIERLLNWTEARPGDTIFIPPGTIHAMGPGLAICEIQQFSDVTYRLYDYGRPRELHLDKACAVSRLDPYRPPTGVPDGFLAYCPYFAAKEVHFERQSEYRPSAAGFELLVIAEGEGLIAGRPYQGGQVWHVPAGAGPFTIAPNRRTKTLVTFVP